MFGPRTLTAHTSVQKYFRAIFFFAVVEADLIRPNPKSFSKFIGAKIRDKRHSSEAALIQLFRPSLPQSFFWGKPRKGVLGAGLIRLKNPLSFFKVYRLVQKSEKTTQNIQNLGDVAIICSPTKKKHPNKFVTMARSA